MEITHTLYLGDGKEILYFDDGHKEYKCESISVQDWLLQNKKPVYCDIGREPHLYCNLFQIEEE